MSENINVKISGWKEGMQKVKLTLLQRNKFGIPLHIAKNNVDQLLNDKSVYVEFYTLEEALFFIEEVKSLGVKSGIIVPRSS